MKSRFTFKYSVDHERSYIESRRTRRSSTDYGNKLPRTDRCPKSGMQYEQDTVKSTCRSYSYSYKKVTRKINVEGQGAKTITIGGLDRVGIDAMWLVSAQTSW